MPQRTTTPTSAATTPPARGVTPIVKDVPGAEGPVFDRDGRFFIVCPSRGQILQVSDDGTLREHANTGGTPAGLQVDRDNHLWVADMKLGVLRVAPDGRVTRVVAEFEGRPMRGCNDLAFDASGNLYVTAPAGSSRDNPVGEIYCRRTDGTVLRLDGGYAFCNGIAVGASGRLLVVAETGTRQLWAYDVTAPGVVADKRLFAAMPGEHRTGADGLDFDADGHLLAANWGGDSIDVFDPAGQLVDRFMLPFHPSNLHFGGRDRRTLYVTEHSTKGVWRTEWSTAGQPEWGLG